jgi:hypothetical protein
LKSLILAVFIDDGGPESMVFVLEVLDFLVCCVELVLLDHDLILEIVDLV